MSAQTPGPTDAEIDRAVAISRAHLLSAHPFFGILLGYLRLEPKPAEWFARHGLCATMATDGVRIVYAREFVRQLLAASSRDLAMGVLAHETLHAALLHVWRREGRDPLLWNIACDMRVNHILAKNDVDLPDDLVRLPSEWEHLPEEAIYERLLKDAMAAQGTGGASGKKGRQGLPGSGLGNTDILPPEPGAGSGDKGGQGDKDAGSGLSPEEMAREWTDRLVRAAHAAKSQGRLPAGIQEIVDEILAPTQDWRALLALFVQPQKIDYDWMRPDRRLLGAYGLYVPTLSGEAVEDIVVALDTSGSISSRELSAFLGELRGILGSFPRVRAHLVTCDAEVWQWQELTEQDPVPTEIQGRGGTDFRPVFSEIDRRGITPTALIFLTDGMGTYPDRPPAYPLLWVLTPVHEEPPFGARTVLQIPESDA
jgi:predicted metal-dependent peptidase